MSTYDRKYAERVMELVRQKADAYREARKAERTGAPMGSDALAPGDVIRFFERKANGDPLKGIPPDPDWIRALALVDGGIEWLRAYERAIGGAA